MYSKLPSEVGETPVKVVFQGVEPGSPQAQLLYHQNMGEISSFHQKARQNRLISGQPGASMQQALPGGGMLRYVYNSGQETIVVRLNPQRPAPRPAAEPTRDARRADPKLAIDVVFEPEIYLAEDLYSFRYDSTATLGGSPGLYLTWHQYEFIVENDASVTSGQYARYPVEDRYPRPAAYVAESDGLVYFDGEEVYTDAGDIIRWGSDPNILGVLKSLESSNAFYTDILSFLIDNGVPMVGRKSDLPGEENTFDDRYADIVGSSSQRLSATYAIVYAVGSTTTSYPRTPIEPVVRDAEVFSAVEFWWRPTVTTTTQVVRRQTEERFDTLNVVGVVADPAGAEPYMSASPGWVTPEPEDSRLRWQNPELADIEVPRALSVEAGLGMPGTAGAGFLAAMKSPPVGPVPDPVDFDVYLSSSNGMRHNMAPGIQDDPLEDPSLETGVATTLNFRIRVREFGDTTPVVIRVVTAADFKTGDGETPGDPPDEEILPVEPDLEWAFAADAGWTDAGGEPTDPQAPKMGTVLADTGPQVKTVVGPPDADEIYYEEVSWTGPLTGMTKLATIRWFPAARPGEIGTAEITLA